MLALVAGFLGPFGSVAAADPPKVSAAPASLAGVVAGTWMGTIYALPGPDPSPSPVLNTFSADGSLIASDGVAPGVGQGTWVQTGANTFSSTMLKFLFDPAGNLSGMVRVQATNTLNSAGDEYISVGHAEIMGPTGKVLATADAGATMTRFRVAPRP